jgi:hypothetical protein
MEKRAAEERINDLREYHAWQDAEDNRFYVGLLVMLAAVVSFSVYVTI